MDYYWSFLPDEHFDGLYQQIIIWFSYNHWWRKKKCVVSKMSLVIFFDPKLINNLKTRTVRPTFSIRRSHRNSWTLYPLNRFHRLRAKVNNKTSLIRLMIFSDMAKKMKSSSLEGKSCSISRSTSLSLCAKILKWPIPNLQKEYKNYNDHALKLSRIQWS